MSSTKANKIPSFSLGDNGIFIFFAMPFSWTCNCPTGVSDICWPFIHHQDMFLPSSNTMESFFFLHFGIVHKTSILGSLVEWCGSVFLTRVLLLHDECHLLVVGLISPATPILETIHGWYQLGYSLHACCLVATGAVLQQIHDEEVTPTYAWKLKIVFSLAALPTLQLQNIKYWFTANPQDSKYGVRHHPSF